MPNILLQAFDTTVAPRIAEVPRYLSEIANKTLVISNFLLSLGLLIPQINKPIKNSILFSAKFFVGMTSLLYLWKTIYERQQSRQECDNEIQALNKSIVIVQDEIGELKKLEEVPIEPPLHPFYLQVPTLNIPETLPAGTAFAIMKRVLSSNSQEMIEKDDSLLPNGLPFDSSDQYKGKEKETQTRCPLRPNEKEIFDEFQSYMPASQTLTVNLEKFIKHLDSVVVASPLQKWVIYLNASEYIDEPQFRDYCLRNLAKVLENEVKKSKKIEDLDQLEFDLRNTRNNYPLSDEIILTLMLQVENFSALICVESLFQEPPNPKYINEIWKKQYVDKEIKNREDECLGACIYGFWKKQIVEQLKTIKTKDQCICCAAKDNEYEPSEKKPHHLQFWGKQLLNFDYFNEQEYSNSFFLPIILDENPHLKSCKIAGNIPIKLTAMTAPEKNWNELEVLSLTLPENLTIEDIKNLASRAPNIKELEIDACLCRNHDVFHWIVEEFKELNSLKIKAPGSLLDLKRFAQTLIQNSPHLVSFEMENFSCAYNEEIWVDIVKNLLYLKKLNLHFNSGPTDFFLRQIAIHCKQLQELDLGHVMHSIAPEAVLFLINNSPNLQLLGCPQYYQSTEAREYIVSNITPRLKEFQFKAGRWVSDDLKKWFELKSSNSLATSFPTPKTHSSLPTKESISLPNPKNQQRWDALQKIGLLTSVIFLSLNLKKGALDQPAFIAVKVVAGLSLIGEFLNQIWKEYCHHKADLLSQETLAKKRDENQQVCEERNLKQREYAAQLAQKHEVSLLNFKEAAPSHPIPKKTKRLPIEQSIRLIRQVKGGEKEKAKEQEMVDFSWKYEEIVPIELISTSVKDLEIQLETLMFSSENVHPREKWLAFLCLSEEVEAPLFREQCISKLVKLFQKKASQVNSFGNFYPTDFSLEQSLYEGKISEESLIKLMQKLLDKSPAAFIGLQQSVENIYGSPMLKKLLCHFPTTTYRRFMDESWEECHKRLRS